ncbi:alpha/beta hydrolase [Vibrio parahaemolyticus]|uniref:alpha/beta hydrolase n=2 Tax=Vibrio parahaemolyticus TaxID=670 RepID=UPI000A3BED66|nr:alpha/beta hydrolase [Vibrio parahaemolyticus]OUJ54363.1 hypothetical protein BTO03_23130 [Vibrio parahaemolyticus]
MIDFLVVEDSDNKYLDIENAIKSVRPDFHIKRVDNVSDAIEEIKGRQYSFVIVDLQLPNERDNINVNAKGGIELIRWVKFNQKRKKCHPPENILVLSQYENLIEEHSKDMSQTRVFSYLYDSKDEQWKESVKDCIEEFMLTKEVVVSKSSDKLIVYSVHGINTNGEWQDSFDTYLKEKTEVSISHFPYKYQYYPIYSFLIPMLRRNEVRRMINELKYCARKAPNSTVHLVGHSFGTYVICEALKEIPLENSPKIGNLILVNSVLKSGYDFSQIVSKHKIDKILCECAINDRILIMSQVFAMGLGMGGRMGFKGVLYKTIHNRFFKGGHSDLFSATKFSDWFNIIMNKEIVYTDERSKVNIVCAVKQSILIAAPYLLLFLVAVPLLLFLG